MSLLSLPTPAEGACLFFHWLPLLTETQMTWGLAMPLTTTHHTTAFSPLPWVGESLGLLPPSHRRVGH